MFGRPASSSSAPAPARREPPVARQRSIPPGLIPFLPVVALVVILIAFVISPWLALALFVACALFVVWRRYQDVKDVDYGTLRRADPWWRAWDEFRRGRSRWDDGNGPSE